MRNKIGIVYHWGMTIILEKIKLTRQSEGDAYIRMLLKILEFSSNVYDDNLESMEELSFKAIIASLNNK